MKENPTAKDYIEDPALTAVFRDVCACLMLTTYDPKSSITREQFVINCYKTADLMIKERNKYK